jgi:hypothetical protein
MHKWKQHKPWFDEEGLDFLDQRRRAKMQWARDPCQSNVDNLNSVRLEVSRHFCNKMKVYLIAKIEELETNSKINNIRDLYRGINDFNPSTPTDECCSSWRKHAMSPSAEHHSS